MEKKKQSFLQSGPGVFLLASLCNILWGSAIPFINLGYRSFAVASGDTATQILFAGLRFTLAGIITIIIRSIMLGHLAVPKKGGAHRVLLLALTQTMLQYFLFYIGVARTEAVKSSIIQGLNSFVAILVACFVFRTEKMTVRKMVGGLLGIAGILVVSLTGSGLSAKFSVGGEGALFLSMVAAATSSSLIKRFGREDDPMTLSGWQFMTGGLVMAVGGYLAGQPIGVSDAPVPGAALSGCLFHLGGAAQLQSGLPRGRVHGSPADFRCPDYHDSDGRKQSGFTCPDRHCPGTGICLHHAHFLRPGKGMRSKSKSRPLDGFFDFSSTWARSGWLTFSICRGDT